MTAAEHKPAFDSPKTPHSLPLRASYGVSIVWIWKKIDIMTALHSIDRLMQETHNSIANALELHLSCTNPSICVIVLLWTMF